MQLGIFTAALRRRPRALSLLTVLFTGNHFSGW